MIFDAKKVSENRTIIMGIAMLCVMFFHSSLEVDEFRVLSFFLDMGDIGVDIFLMMSGFGIYCSLNECADLQHFFRKRLLRILPAYLLIDGLWFMVFDGVGIRFVYDISTLSFWIDGSLKAWYIAAIFMLYIITPYVVKKSKRNSKYYIIGVMVSILIGALIRLSPLQSIFGHLLIFVFRIPAYICGLVFGKWYVEKKKVYFHRIILLIPIFAVAVCLISMGYTSLYFPWAFKYVAYLPIALLLIYVISYFNRGKRNRMLYFWGKHSLEIYLLHEKVLWVLTYVKDKVSNRILIIDFKNIGINLIVIVVTCYIAMIISQVCTWKNTSVYLEKYKNRT